MVANCQILIVQYSTLAYVGLALGKEVMAYADLDELRRLLPVQGGRAAESIASVCREVLHCSVETLVSARHGAQPALVPVEVRG
jgi:hypothetical protein